MLTLMFKAQATEFPFMETLPKGEKGKIAKVWDQLNAVRAAMDEKGLMLPQHLVAELLGVSRQRICQFIDEDRLEVVTVAGDRYITEKSFLEFARIERKNGRPVKAPSNADLWKASMATAKEIVKKT